MYKKDLLEILSNKLASLVYELFDDLETTKADEIPYEYSLSLFSQPVGETMRQILFSVIDVNPDD